jgi:hypothetical protein
MFKRILITLFFVWFSSTLLLGQNSEEGSVQGEENTLRFDMGITFGLSSYEDVDGESEGYQKLGFYPGFGRGLWRFGFDFTLEFDGDFNLRDLNNDGKPDTWTTWYDWLYKLQYVSYAEPGDPIYGLVGEFNSYYMGYGMLVRDFNNDLFKPYILQRGLLFDFDAGAVNFPYIGVATLSNDVLDWDVIGARLFVKPFAGLQSPLLSQLEFGGTFVTDLDPLQQYSSMDVGPPSDNPASTPVTTFGIDAGLPLVQNDDMDVMAYVDWGAVSGRGQGISAGADLRYAWFRLLAELRFLGSQYVPHYFDSFYWVERPYKYDGLALLNDSYFGYLVGADMNLWDFATLYFHWEDGLAEAIEPRIKTGLILSNDVWKRIGFHITYDKKGIGSFEDFARLSDSLFELLFEYRVTDFASIVFIQQQSFIPYSSLTLSSKSVSQTVIETRFLF